MRRLSLLLVVVACASEPPRPPASAPVEVPVSAPVVEPTAPVVATSDVLDLELGLHRAKMSEVFLDLRGEAAVTVDVDGGARLWPELRAETPGLPVVLPLVEATSISLARAGERSFVIAAIDTAGGARVSQVDLAGERPRWRPLCGWTPLEPTLELHALDGGERLLRLGRDHSVSLHDRRGATLSRLEAPGFVPWQLRVAQTPGEPMKLAVVLTDPVRVQAVTLAGDALTLTGEPRQVALDQGPNHNDLILAPDGSFVTSLRRPRAKGRAWTLELIELASGGRRWLAGEVDTQVRPRLHLVDAGRALLESGSGKGYWIDLAAAITPPAGFDRNALPKTTSAKVEALPGSSEDSRMWSTIAGGLRAVIVDDALIVDSLADDTGWTLAPNRLEPTRGVLSPDGQTVAWYAGGVWVERLADRGSLRELQADPGESGEMRVIDRDRLVKFGPRGKVTLYRIDQAAPLASVTVPAPYGLGRVDYHPLDGARGELVVAASRRSISIIPVDGDQLGPRREVASWPELAPMTGRTPQRLREQVRVATGDAIDGDISESAGDRHYVLTRSPRQRLYQVHQDQVRSLDLPLREDGSRYLYPAPNAARVAVVDHVSREYAALHVVDFAGEVPVVRWTRAYGDAYVSPSWSDDGTRLAIAWEGGWVYDATTGDVVYERRDLGVKRTALAR